MRTFATSIVLLLALGLAGCGDEGGRGGSAGPVGTWVVDIEKFVDDFTAMFVEKAGMDAPPEQIEEARKGVAIEFAIAKDGTWRTTGVVMGQKVDDAGTWKLEGERLNVTWTQKDGKPIEEARSVAASYDGTAIVIMPDPDMPFSLRMVRK